jgi:type IV pilus assembly protein PilV
MSAMRPVRRSAGGFSMIEVLIALVVLGIGLLGLALLQTMNLRYTKSAQQRTQAINLASELLDTMRANRSEAAAYLAITRTSFGSATPPAGGCVTYAALTSANNIARWKCEVREALGPQAEAEVLFVAPNYRVTVIWNEDLLPALTGKGQIVLETRI